MKKRIALILAVIATVSTLGSNAVMARYDPICTHPVWHNVNSGINTYSSDGQETHTVYEKYYVYCAECNEFLYEQDLHYGTEAHSCSWHTEVLYTEENPDGTYAFYEYTYVCDLCGQVVGDPVHEYQPYP